jgi:gamma-glutamylcyclotransferase
MDFELADAAPANLCLDPDAEAWGVLYRMTRRDLMRLDSTEGVPGRGYLHVVVEAEDTEGRLVQAVTYIAHGKEVDGRPSLRYIHCCARVLEPTGCRRITSAFWKA